MTITATYSPEDNKLRLYASARLDPETYARVKAAGFRWAPKQDLCVAPAWTPEREDLCLALAGEVDDEDASLVDRAEARAERFGESEGARTAEAEAARQTVHTLAGAMNGQPILIGHHSEKRHRRDLARMDAAMHRSVTAWRTAEYWRERAAGAVRLAKYKQRPDVRARRIKTLEAEARKIARQDQEAADVARLWTVVGDDRARALAVLTRHDIYYQPVEGAELTSLWRAVRDETMSPTEAAGIVRRIDEAAGARRARWADHLARRLEYERAMLAGDGGTVADRTGPEVGGAVRCWASPRGGWSTIVRVNKTSVTVYDNWGNGGPNFTRTIAFDKLAAVLPAGEVEALRAAGRLTPDAAGRGFYVTETAEGGG